MTLTVKNWSEFQHYRDRKPAWIKLHRELLDNYEWHRLPDASRALAPMLWLLASESETGTISGEIDEIAFRLRTSAEKVVAGLNPLISAGFFILEQNASAPLANAEHSATSESEVEEQEKEEAEEKRERCGAVAPSPLAPAVALFNDMADEHNWPKVQVLSKPRKRALTACLKAVGGIEGWQDLLAKVTASDFLMGRTARSGEHANWRFDFDFLVQPKRYIKIMEGGYGNSPNSQRAPERGLGAALAALAD